ncbi:Metacaspase-7 [Mycena venus]|uniref:Metacaspase-7 n=1 Tax=Mycena venus TaxID=2733690 RepID=A0A8H6YD79_9AGAR|nr:Metacaspase-7 [Mycena venus]
MSQASETPAGSDPLSASTGKDTVFALVIGINDYIAKDSLQPLLGAVNDAKAFEKYLMEKLDVPQPNILLIENEKATRAAILSAFRSHLLENKDIPDHGEATMIFFFAGHGSRADAPRNIISRDQKVETLCPVDERTTNEAGEYVHTIPDYTLGWLLWELAERKGRNITVILDSCHSGGMGRMPERTRTANSESRPIPQDLDSHLWKDAKDTAKSHRMWAPTATSHVLLAACRSNEQANEAKFKDGYGGRFSTTLVSLLRWAPIESITYEELMRRMPQWYGQTPHCGGSGVDGLIFKGNYPKTGRRSVPLMLPQSQIGVGADSSMLFRVEMGTLEGVLPGTEFSAYTKENNFLCKFVAQSVLVDHSILVSKDVTPVSIPRWSRVMVSDWKNNAMILHVHIPADFPYTDVLFPPSHPVSPPRFVQAPSLEEAHIVVRIDQASEEVVVTSRTPTMLKVQAETRFPLEGEPARLRDALDGVAHFNFFLDRGNAEDPIEGFALEMHRLVGEHPHRVPDTRVGENGNMVKDGAVQFVSEEGAKYGFTIRNDSSMNLFPYLFYFDPETFTIQQWYSPEGRYALAPLRSGERDVKIGMGSERAFEFMLEPGQVSSSGFLKLFVTREFVDLKWINQAISPFSLKFRGAPRDAGEGYKFDKMTWDALTVTLTMTASSPAAASVSI